MGSYMTAEPLLIKDNRKYRNLTNWEGVRDGLAHDEKRYHNQVFTI